MLLTSGQVSVAFTSFIIFLCTSALFLSGYVVQQRTVSEIRAAIKPVSRPSHPNSFVLPPSPREPLLSSSNTQQDSAQLIEVPKALLTEDMAVPEGPLKPIAATQKDDAGGPDTVGTEGYFFTRSKKGGKKWWGGKAKTEEVEDIPLEMLSGPERRKKIKKGIVKLDDPILDNTYRPRKRLW